MGSVEKCFPFRRQNDQSHIQPNYIHVYIIINNVLSQVFQGTWLFTRRPIKRVVFSYWRAAVIWPKYCRYGVRHYIINQSIILENLDHWVWMFQYWLWQQTYRKKILKSLCFRTADRSQFSVGSYDSPFTSFEAICCGQYQHLFINLRHGSDLPLNCLHQISLSLSLSHSVSRDDPRFLQAFENLLQKKNRAINEQL